METSSHLKNFTKDRAKNLEKLLPKNAKALKYTTTLCPVCVQKESDEIAVDGLVFAHKNKVWISKKCKKHGIFTEVYYGDYDYYKKMEKYHDPGIKIQNPEVDKNNISCPHDCGLCKEHESHTALGNIVLTNRCDLSCWYCFFYAKPGDAIYEPSLDQIRMMLRSMKEGKPVGANAVQLTGGEPTLRKDLLDIVKIAKEEGYDHIQLNTNAINLSKDPALVKRLRKEGLNTIYMSFDGVTPQTNPKNYWEAIGAMENCRKAGTGIVLVPTIIGGINDHEMGDIIRFASGNIDVIRAVNFQPVSLVGRMPDSLRKRQRITIPTCIKRIEDQTDGQIGLEDFFPVPCTKSVTDFIEAIKEKPKYRLSIHFACGAATYIFKEGDKLIPITKFFDVQGFFEYLDTLTEEIKSSGMKKLRKTYVMAKLLVKINKFVDEERKPKGLKFMEIMKSAMGGGNYTGLGEFHHKSLFIGLMHFQDPYNWDIDRAYKCDIHYAMPDGKIVPFCTFNVIPHFYRDKIQEQFSIPFKQWEKTAGKSLKKDVYKRKFSAVKQKKIKYVYSKFIRNAPKPKLKGDWDN